MASLYATLISPMAHGSVYSSLTEINTLRPDSPQHSKAKANLHLVEEMSELTKEIIKIYVRDKERGEEFHEELADVILLLDQAVRLADPFLLHQKIEYKINRFKERYQDGRV